MYSNINMGNEITASLGKIHNSMAWTIYSVLGKQYKNTQTAVMLDFPETQEHNFANISEKPVTNTYLKKDR